MNEVASAQKPRVDVDRSLLFLLFGTARGLEGRLEAALGEIGLSLAKAGVLKALTQAGGSMSLGDVALCNRCVPSNVTQLIDRLEEDGLVKRSNDPEDRRVRRASLTPAGQQAYRDAGRIVHKHERMMVEVLSPADTIALRKVLGQLTELVA